MRRVLVGLMLLAGLTAGARADEVQSFSQAYAKILDGDFLLAGNGSVRCPVAADNAPSTGDGNSPQACADAANRGNNRVNDNFFMQWSDVDSDPATFNSSTATPKLPAGAKVEHARLSWGGNTGVFADSTVRMCQSRESERPAILPGGSPNQPVKLTVGSATSEVAPATFRVDAPGTFRGSSQLYTASADVTAAFAGGPAPVTVANVWTPKGFGCVGGWSIVLVYSQSGAAKRHVMVFDGHVRQNIGDEATTLRVNGFRAATAEARVGLTAYEGDWGIGGDRFLVNGSSPADNFFVSQAEGRPNNFSVDARTLTVPVGVGATTVDLGFATTGDSYLAQNVVVSIAVPALQVAVTADKPAVHPGDQVTFTTTVTNSGGVPVRDVRVSSTTAARDVDCGRIQALEPGQSQAVTCQVTAPPDDFTHTVAVTAATPIGEVDGSASVPVEVLNPAVKLTKQADRPAYRVGDAVTFTIKVDNAGDTPLTGIEVVDAKTPGCARKLAEPSTFTCTATAPVPDDVNVAEVGAADRLGKRVTAAAQAPVKVIHPNIQVTKDVAPGVVRQGDTVTFTIAVRNTGDTPLSGVGVADDVPGCGKQVGELGAGDARTYTCTQVAGAASTTTKATVTGTDITTRTVTATDDASYAVIHPGISIALTTAGPYKPGDTVTFTVSVRNTGDVPLTDVTVTTAVAPDCARVLGELRDKADYTCTMTAPADDVTALATATGKAPVGPPVSGVGAAFVDIRH
ncbi:DUF7507 domain-containing protein [Kibdelosporangium phytohabitans]|uniref:DUF7507 domain-containing protein n=1 Tax=Kibdelosporangium phytohabitans TaxID=860235 RepID=A0A0N9IH78_9PSEU|nr:NEW3 domain-containing protein [Kibdelosporangium phytohabitans]ALG14322.1 hypothetical protein AOZ06_52270 [Kibdelosporangium phytohabitans]MBE1466662.1 putative repeat protein (TIGR01451 family) [Kibdelosporangium phytohabitans]